MTAVEAVTFVRTCLAELLRFRRTGCRGAPAGMEAREETYFRDPKRRAFVLIVRGRGFAPPVYVKWILGPTEAAPEFLRFVSFHEARGSGARA